MSASFWDQCQIGLWKWWLIRKKQPFLIFSEILWPCLLLVGLILLHPLAEPGAHTTCYFKGRASPSAGMFQFAQSYMCNLNNFCYNETEYEEIPTFPQSR